MKFPRRIKPGTANTKTICTIDLMPTIAKLAGAELPENTIDGKDVWPIIVGRPNAKNPGEYYPFSTGRTFEGLITADGKWKLHVPHNYRTLVTPGKDGAAGKYKQAKIELSLFDMQNDPLETTNVIDKHPEVAAKLKALAEKHRQTFYASKTN